MVPVAATPYLQLKSLLKEANYDAALAILTRADLRTFVLAADGMDELSRLRFRCMISEVLDYGGLYPKAAFVLDHRCPHIGKAAEADLRPVHDIHDLRDPAFAKRQCWALMMWGLTYYRSFEFDLAMPLFELARRIAEIIHNTSNISSIGTLARAWYCIGLVHRENRDAGDARAAFREAIKLTSKGIEERRTRNESTASFEFNMARCAGLGMGWIAYNEANLKEADAMLILARGRMLSAKANLIRAYLDTLQASIIMSESGKRSAIDDALRLLTNAHSTFAPSGSHTHAHYALRCQNEIALAHLRLARTYRVESPEREKHFQAAESAVAAVHSTARGFPKTAQRSACRALITEARVKRERGLFDQALRLAEQAKGTAGNSKLLRVDAYIGIGEAEFARGVYGSAITAFLEALSKCQNDRKDASACHLHLVLAYIKNNQPTDAKHHFSLWESMAANLDNAFIRALAEKAREALSNMFHNFERTKEDILRDGDHKHHLDSLRHWLATTAMDLDHGNEFEAALRLKLKSTATLREWLAKSFSP